MKKRRDKNYNYKTNLCPLTYPEPYSNGTLKNSRISTKRLDNPDNNPNSPPYMINEDTCLNITGVLVLVILVWRDRSKNNGD